MSTIQFKTNINCSGCVAKATPALNQVAGVHNWQVDTANPQKILTVNTSTSAQAIIAALQAIGFKASIQE
ncbi:copper chaperone [Chitinophaga costaii]|uniref:Copper chaperone n=1 Tax=Chitinophaga costaii TaxID=1335309 RepID=A0A1C4FBD2_9BACT|nr:cation transporter [Chitinophaga costaii]PUZ20732.1 hypothetical protein DCM91_18405 [Chitinophaga costaii]SCC52933.1 copper chaperone [Chitinophaga costaii]